MSYRVGAVVAAAWFFGVTGAGTAATAPDLSPPASNAGDPLTLSDADNGRTIQLTRGAEFRLVLRSTYWRPNGTSNPAVVAAEGPPTTAAGSEACVPGAGCGTVTQSFVAVGAGQAEVSADRSLCGEALRCRPGQQHFAVSLVVRE